MPSRREFITQGASAVLAINGLSATAQTVSAEQPVGAADVGIVEEVRKLFESGNGERAIKLLEQHDIYHSATHQVRGKQNSDGVSTEDYWNQSKCSVSFAGYKLTGDLYEGSLGYDVSGESSIPGEYAYPKDAIRLSWKPDQFTYKNGSLNHNFHLKNPDDGISGATGITVANEPGIESPGSAIGLKVDDNYTTYSSDGFYGSAAFQATKTESSQGWFAGDYTHTWTLGIANGGITFTAGGPIGIGIELPTGKVDNWELPKTTDEKLVNL